MVDFVNAELGGIEGRPVEIVSCNVGKVAFTINGADEAACATRLGGDPQVTVVLAMAQYEVFESTLAAQKPLLLSWPGAGTDGVSYHPGSLENVTGLGLLGLSLMPSDGLRQIAYLGEANEAVLLQGRLGDIEVLDVEAGSQSADKNTVEEMVAAIEQAGAEDAPVVAGYAPGRLRCDRSGILEPREVADLHRAELVHPRGLVHRR